MQKNDTININTRNNLHLKSNKLEFIAFLHSPNKVFSR